MPRNPFKAPPARNGRTLKLPTLPAQDIIRQVAGAEEDEFERRFALWGRGSRPEFVAWEWLTIRKRQKEGIDFDFTSSMFGGRTIFGGMVVDFYLFAKDMVWRVQGEYFHLVQPENRAKDRLDRQRLVGQNLIVVDLYAQDLLQRPTFVLEKAWRGDQVQNPVADF